MKVLFVLLFAFTSFFSQNDEPQSLDLCPFTYEQGYHVGCKLARQANADGCKKFPICFQRYVQNTLDDFQECGDYVLGVQEGFSACFVHPTWENNDGSDHDGDVDHADPNEGSDFDCVWNPRTRSWDCP